MNVRIIDAPVACLNLARQRSMRINHELMQQYVMGRIGGLPNGQREVHYRTLAHWVNSYEHAFNKPAETAYRKRKKMETANDD